MKDVQPLFFRGKERERDLCVKMAKTFAAGRERENSESFSPARNTKFTHLENEDDRASRVRRVEK